MTTERTEIDDRLAILNLIDAVNELHRAVNYLASMPGVNEDIKKLAHEALIESFEGLKRATDAEVRTVRRSGDDDGG